MNKPIIHFAHANGFPARTYTKLFSYLSDDYEINYLERHAHDPRYPVTDNWTLLVEELKQEFEKFYGSGGDEGGGRQIIGVGHSLGGILHFLVAVRNPEFYRALVLLDAPLISRLSGRGIRFLKATGLIDKFPPVRSTRFRRSVWQTKSDAFEHFRAKAKFSSFDEDVLRDYIEHGTTTATTAAPEDGERVKLLFEPRIEAEIYRTIPHDFAQYRGKLKIPAAYIGGTRSTEARLARLGFMRKNFPVDFYTVEGSHLYPFEKPVQTAHLIKTAISNFGF